MHFWIAVPYLILFGLIGPTLAPRALPVRACQSGALAASLTCCADPIKDAGAENGVPPPSEKEIEDKEVSFLRFDGASFECGDAEEDNELDVYDRRIIHRYLLALKHADQSTSDWRFAGSDDKMTIHFKQIGKYRRDEESLKFPVGTVGDEAEHEFLSLTPLLSHYAVEQTRKSLKGKYADILSLDLYEFYSEKTIRTVENKQDLKRWVETLKHLNEREFYYQDVDPLAHCRITVHLKGGKTLVLRLALPNLGSSKEARRLLPGPIADYYIEVVSRVFQEKHWGRF